MRIAYSLSPTLPYGIPNYNISAVPAWRLGAKYLSRPGSRHHKVSAMTKITIVAATLLLCFSQSVSASDWQFSGAGDDERGRPQFLFYDAQTLTQENGVVRFWEMAVLKQKIDLYLKRHEHEVLDEVAGKMKSGYRPKMLSVGTFKKLLKDDDKRFNATVEIMSAEIIVATGDLSASSKEYYELDCAARKLRILDVTAFSDDGKIIGATHARPSDWTYVVPDSNSENEALMFCRN